MMAAISSAKTIAKPALEPTCRISSTGSSEMMPNATAPEDKSTPRKLKKPGPEHGDVGRHRVRVDDGRDGVGGVVEAVDEFEAERDQQRHAQEQKGQPRRDRRAGRFDVLMETIGRVEQAAREQRQEYKRGNRTGFVIELGFIAWRARS